MLNSLRRKKDQRKYASFFDSEYYLRTYPDVAAAAVDPLRHYLEHGWREGRDPSSEFDGQFYLNNYPDVAQSGINPLVHYVDHGRFENRATSRRSSSQPPVQPPAALHTSREAQHALLSAHMDKAFYLSTYHDVARAGIDPVSHFLDNGWSEGRNPIPDFCTAFYLDEYPDVRHSGLNPFVHYILRGKAEGRSASSPILDRIALKPVAAPWQKTGRLKHKYDISVVIPTYNRAHMLPALLESWRATHARTRYPYEIIFSDDGSDDATLSILEAARDLPIKLVRNDHGGAAKARNAAVRAASGEKILFLGDDIFPDLWLVNRHVEKHRRLPDTDAVLGLCDWHPDLAVNHLMRHITEIGCEQFSFSHFRENGYTDFRHFYTCNISIDREFLLSEDTIFNEAFYKVNFEDIELGYRLAQKGMRIYYYPEAYGDHYHPYNDVGRFCTRQAIAGEMAIVFRQLHPEVAHLLPLRAIEERWRPHIGDGLEVFDFYSALVALCQDAEDSHEHLGDSGKADLSRIYTMLFRFAFEEGYCRHHLAGVTADVSNRVLRLEFIDAACARALNALLKRVGGQGHAGLAAALHDRRPLAPVVAASQSQAAPAAHGLGEVTSPEVLLTIVAENWSHLNELMAMYRGHRGRVGFALASAVGFEGMVYAPARGGEISAMTLSELLLLIECNPAIDTIVLSHGLYDLPRIGVRRGAAADILQRRGSCRRGKVVRIFDAIDTEVSSIEALFGGRIRAQDANGYLQF